MLRSGCIQGCGYKIRHLNLCLYPWISLSAESVQCRLEDKGHNSQVWTDTLLLLGTHDQLVIAFWSNTFTSVWFPPVWRQVTEVFTTSLLFRKIDNGTCLLVVDIAYGNGSTVETHDIQSWVLLAFFCNYKTPKVNQEQQKAKTKLSSSKDQLYR